MSCEIRVGLLEVTVVVVETKEAGDVVLDDRLGYKI